MLRRAGIDAQLRIGVGKEGARDLRAHAWVECGGAALLGEDLGPFRSLGRLPG
jgi:hypothetical protein